MSEEFYKINNESWGIDLLRQGWSDGSIYQHQRPFSMSDSSRTVSERDMLDRMYNETMCDLEEKSKKS